MTDEIITQPESETVTALSQDQIREAFGTSADETTIPGASLAEAVDEPVAEPDPRSTGRGLGTGRRKEKAC